MERALCVYVQHFNMQTHLKRHHPGVIITVAVEGVQTQLTTLFQQPLSGNSEMQMPETNLLGFSLLLIYGLRNKQFFFNIPLKYYPYHTVT